MLKFTDTNGQTFPVAIARLVSPYSFNPSPRLIVDRCPLCGETHQHSLASTDGTTCWIYGKRQSDCMRGEYLLVDTNALTDMPVMFTDDESEATQ